MSVATSMNEKSAVNPGIISEKLCFQNRIEDFLATINIQDDVIYKREDGKTKVTGAQIKAEFRTETVRLALTIQNKMGATILRALSREFDFFEEFTHFKKQYLDMSAYIHKTLWRDVIYFIQMKDFRNNDAILNKDIMYCVKHLTDSDIEKIINMQINHSLNASLEIDVSNFTTGKTTQRGLYEYVESKAATLKFLSKYDFGNDQEDFVHDLMEEMIRVNNGYNKSSGKNLNAGTSVDNSIKQYIETALNNKVNQVKDYWSSDVRRRVTSTHSPLYRRRGNLRKILKKETDLTKIAEINKEIGEINEKLRTGSHDYYSTVTPLVRTNESENREVDAQEIDPSTIEEVDTEEELWAHDLILDLTPRISRCVGILMGTYDEEFTVWTTKQKKYNLDMLDHHFKAAMEFCNVTKEELKSNPVILQALSTAPSTRKSVFQKNADILVQNLTTKKIHPAKLEDTRDDGSIIFRLVNAKDQKDIDTNYDKKWKLISNINH
jgi:hypothetical protein